METPINSESREIRIEKFNLSILFEKPSINLFVGIFSYSDFIKQIFKKYNLIDYGLIFTLDELFFEKVLHRRNKYNTFFYDKLEKGKLKKFIDILPHKTKFIIFDNIFHRLDEINEIKDLFINNRHHKLNILIRTTDIYFFPKIIIPSIDYIFYKKDEFMEELNMKKNREKLYFDFFNNSSEIIDLEKFIKILDFIFKENMYIIIDKFSYIPKLNWY